MQVEKKPYELLFRWNQDGALQGAHIAYRYVIREDDGSVIGDREEAPKEISSETAAGFPLADVLDQGQIDALVAKAAADQEREVAATARDAALQAQQVAEQGLVGMLSDLAASRERIAALQAERDAALARVAQLEAQVAAPRPAFE
ncbi:hypothetical protein CRT60_21850 [Azospirillum palustre]|uniref:Uncharacterized protein n=1 Tax=Azospirillum palustre TaxID=2044885 RepID=A0A2B8BDV7_9PROT|nr:hypothetical protein [Azospirillum palustre]PGH55899.1 hypothetical protein CRT60_21850 [Azospirillum palustre]